MAAEGVGPPLRLHNRARSASGWRVLPSWCPYFSGCRRVLTLTAVVGAAALLLLLLARPRSGTAPRIPIPVDITCPAFPGGEVYVSMCYLDRARYALDPSAYPMFRDQVSNLCDSKFETTLKALRLRLDGVPTPEGTESATGVRGGANKEPTGLQAVTRQPPARPAGLVFHMTRCGSTLVANMFGSVLSNMVLTESRPPASLLQCPTLSEREKVVGLRTLIRAMGAPTRGRNVVLKFQSALVAHNRVIRMAFPSTPWVFLFRKPDEVMASLLYKNGKMFPSSNAPCLRSRHSPPQEVLQTMSMTAYDAVRAPPEQYCAAHLASLMAGGLRGLNSSQAPAVAVEYQSLPESVMTVVAPLFGITVTESDSAKMAAAGATYSKSRRPITGGRSFESDSKAKAQIAAQTKAAQFANLYTSSLYAQLREFTTPAVGGLRVSQTDDTSDYPEHVVHLGHLLDWWNPDEVRVPKSAPKFDTLARLGYRNPASRAQAVQFRRAELPFVVTDLPELVATSARWTRAYLEQHLTGKYPVDVRQDNRFMHHAGAQLSVSDRAHVSFADWAAATEEHFHWHVPGQRAADCNFSAPIGAKSYWYMRVNTRQAGGDTDTDVLYKDLPFFNPDDLLFGVGLPAQTQNPIECRFGPAGVTEAPVGRNHHTFIAVVRGALRFILVPPSQCPQLRMYPPAKAGPSHSRVAWAARWQKCGERRDANSRADKSFDASSALNVVVRAGQVLFIPSFWVHTTVALTDTSHCRISAGRSSWEAAHAGWLQECGFSLQAGGSSDASQRITTRARYQADFAEFNAVTPAAMYGMGIGYTYPRVVTQPLGAPAGPPGRGSDPDQADGVFEWPETGAGMIQQDDLAYLHVNASSFRRHGGSVPVWAARDGSASPWRFDAPEPTPGYSTVFLAVPCGLLVSLLWLRGCDGGGSSRRRWPLCCLDGWTRRFGGRGDRIPSSHDHGHAHSGGVGPHASDTGSSGREHDNDRHLRSNRW